MRVRTRLSRDAYLVCGVMTATLFAGCNSASSESPSRRAGADSSRVSGAAGAMPAMPGMSALPGMQMSADGSALLSASAVQQFGITFDIAADRELQATLRTTGTVSVDESGMAAVTVKTGGFVERLDAKVTGRRVVRGEALAAMFSPEILVAQEELLVAERLRASMDHASDRDSTRDVALVSAARRRLRLLDVTDEQIDRILRTRRVERTTPLVAPVSGVITQRMISEGQAVPAGMLLFMIADLSKLWIDVRIPAVSGAGVREGMLATYSVTGVPGRTYSGRVAYIYPTVGDQSRTLSARVLVRNDDGALKPGMFATVALVSPGRRALTVPRAAVIETGTRSVVFVDMGGGRLMPHDVDVGATTSELAEIISGLSAGQRVVTSAQFLLESESNMAEVMRGMIGMGGAARSGDAGMQGMEMGPGRAMPATSPPSVRR